MTQSFPVLSVPSRHAPMEFPTVFWVFGGLLLFYVIYNGYCRLEAAISGHRFARTHDCKPVKPSPTLNTFSNEILGWKVPLLLINAYKAGNVLEVVQKCFFRNCHTVRVKLLSTNIIFTIEPENLKTILASNFKEWTLSTRRKRAMDATVGHGIFNADGPIWKQSRELLRPNFARSQIDNPETLEPHVSALIDAIPHDGSTFDLQELFSRFTTSTAIEFLFGFDQSTSKELSTAFSAALYRLVKALDGGWRLGKLMTLFGASLKKDSKITHDFIDHYIDLALKDREKYTVGRIQGERYVFLHEVVQRTQDPEQIRSEILHILLAGKDTTAGLLSHTWFLLAKRPDVWAKLRADVDNLNGEKPSFAALQEMKYLKAVLNECRVSRTHNTWHLD